MAGLSSAIILAKQGLRVALVEKGKAPAPVLSGFMRSGLHCETGLHATGLLGANETLAHIFRYLDVWDQLKPLPFKQTGSDRIILPDGKEMHLGYGESYVSELLAQFPDEEEAIMSYAAMARKEFERSSFLHLRPDMGDFEVNLPNEESLTQYLDKLTTNPYLRLALSIRCLYYGVPPEQAPLNLHALVDSTFIASVHNIAGGGRALVKALLSSARRAGVVLYLGNGVEDVLSSEQAFRGVRLAGGAVLTAANCIYTGHPSLLPGLCAGDETGNGSGALKPAYVRRLGALKETVSLFMGFASVQGPLPELEGSVFYLCPENELGKMIGGVDPEHDIIYLHLTAADGGERYSLNAIMPCSLDVFAGFEQDAPEGGKKSAAYVAMKQQILDKMEGRILEALPQLRGRVSWLDSSSPLSMRHYANNPRAGIYGVKHVLEQIPPLPVTKIKGLYLAGQSVLLPGVLGSAISALVACGLVSDMKKIHMDLLSIANNYEHKEHAE